MLELDAIRLFLRGFIGSYGLLRRVMNFLMLDADDFSGRSVCFALNGFDQSEELRNFKR